MGGGDGRADAMYLVPTDVVVFGVGDESVRHAPQQIICRW